MASNILSRLLPSAIEDPPDGFSPDYSDHQRATPLAVDEENLSQQFQDQDLDQLLEDAAQNEDETENTAFPVEKRVTRQLVGDEPLLPEQKAHARLEQDDDVPQSLLLDPDRRRNAPTTSKPFKTSAARSSFLPPPVPGPSFQGSTMRGRPPRNRETNELPRSAHSQPGEHPRHGWSAFITADPRQKALWRWANVQNLDHFLSDVYSYYLERGIFSILLSRLINLL